MSSLVNSFALLGDEDGDDMAVLAQNLIAKKAAVAAAVVDQSTQGNDAVYDHGRNDRGGRGRGGYNNGYDDDYNGGYGYGRGNGGNMGRGQRGYYNERQGYGPYNGGNRNNTINGAGSAGWEHVRPYGNEVYYNNGGDGRRFRNYGGDQRRGYGGGNRGFRGSNGGSRSDQSNNGDVVEGVNGAADGNVAEAQPAKSVSEGDAAPVTEQAKSEGSVKADSEEAKLPREGKAEGSVKVDKRARKEQEAAKKEQEARKEADRKYREQYAKWRSLEEYEQLLAEKRKALETLKNEERRVVADKDFEDMERVAKKKPEEALLKPEAPKLKKKPEAPKHKKKDSLEKEEMSLKAIKTVSISEFLKPAGDSFYRPAGRGRGRGGDSRNSDRADNGFRNGGRGDTGPAAAGDFRSGVRAEQGRGAELKNGKPASIRTNKDAPEIHFEEVEFPALKGAARAV